MNNDDIVAVVHELKANTENNTKKLDEHDKEIDDIRKNQSALIELTASVKIIANDMTYIKEDIKEVKTDMSEVKNKQINFEFSGSKTISNRWNTFVISGIAAFAGIIATYITTRFF